jgi:hypothetical protein
LFCLRSNPSAGNKSLLYYYYVHNVGVHSLLWRTFCPQPRHRSMLQHALAPPPQSPRRLYHVPAITAAARSHLGYSRPGSSPQSRQRPNPTSPGPWHAPELPASPKIRPRSSIVDGACSLNLHHAPASASRPLRTSNRVADTAPPRVRPCPRAVRRSVPAHPSEISPSPRS